MTRRIVLSEWRVAHEHIVAEYRRLHPGSARAVDRLAKVMPGGDTRNVAWFEPFPLVIDSARGLELRDIDGNVLLDFICNYTSLIHGHCPSFIAAAIQSELGRGYIFAAPMEEQGMLAEELLGRLRSADLVRFTNSGTEATMLAQRIASKYTGRERFAVAEHSYHGANDTLDWQEASRTGTAVFPINDIEAARNALDEADPLAAIFVEPVLGSGGIITVENDFLAFLRDYADASGAVLVFDEVMTFRLGFGGRQEATGVTPDLTTLGKFIGGGMPIGAVAGREAVMEVADPTRSGHVKHSGTWNGHRLAMVAGRAALRALDHEAIERLNSLGDYLAAGVRAAAAQSSVPVSVTSCGSMLNLHAAQVVSTPAEAQDAASSPLAQCLHLGLLNRGIFMAPRGEMCIATPTDEETIDQAVAALAEVLAAAEGVG